MNRASHRLYIWAFFARIAHNVSDRPALRVAALATLVVACVYLAIATVLAVIVSTSLTGSIDHELNTSLTDLGPQFAIFAESNPGGVPYPDEPGPGGAPFSEPLLVWLVVPGAVLTNTASDLPQSDINIRSPQTVTLDGTSVRLEGSLIDGTIVIVGESFGGVNQTVGALVLTEGIVLPVLVVVVFLGSWNVGERVATPYERARQRQLEFSANASHELRTPLAVIEAQASLATSGKRSVAWFQDAFARVSGEARRMHALVNDLLWLSRFDTEVGAQRFEHVDVGAVAQGTADRFAALAETHHLTITAQIAGHTNVVSARSDWIDHLISVLVDNAIKYTPESGRITIQVATVDKRVTLAVNDTGPGISPNDQERILKRFERATDVAGGAGLGLSIADAVVHGTSGRWAIGVAPGGGASMGVSWPQSLVSSDPSN